MRSESASLSAYVPVEDGRAEPQPLIVLDAVTKAYATGAHTIRALDNVTLSISAGDFVICCGNVASQAVERVS